MKVRIKYIALLLALFFGMAACGSPEGSTPNLWENIYKTPAVNLQKWVGYYCRDGNTESNGSLTMDFFLYEDKGQFYGYFSIDGWEYIEVNGEKHAKSINQRMLTTVSQRGKEVFVYFYEEIPVENVEEDSAGGQEIVSGTYSQGDLLFSMKMEGEDIITTWEKAFPMETAESLAERKFIRRDFLSCELIGEKDKEAFLAARGVQNGEAPFFEHYDEDGTLLLVYTDDPSAGGTGIYSYYSMGGSLYIHGFEILPCRETAWVDARFDVTKDGDNGEGRTVENYEEGYEYNDGGQPVRFLSEGTITGWGEPYWGRIIEINWFYREDGTLERKKAYYNDRIFGTTGLTETCFYDEEERLIHSYAYITHGSTENYYMYLGDDAEPDYCLMLDHFGADTCALEFIHYTE